MQLYLSTKSFFTLGLVSLSINGSIVHWESILGLPVDYGDIDLIEIGGNVYNHLLEAHLGSVIIYSKALDSAQIRQAFDDSSLEGQ